MRHLSFVALAVAALAVAPLPALAAGFTLTSPDIADGTALSPAQVYNGFGCTGGNTSPALSWSGEPEGTRSFAVTVYDPDAPTGSGWWHWVVFNLPAGTHSLPAGAGTAAGTALPAGAVQSMTDYGSPGFGGACPPPGDRPHRYQFTVHALKEAHLPADGHSSGAMAGYFIKANTLATATITASYGR